MYNKNLPKPATDFYSILNIPPEASKTEIKKAFREMAKRYHPDLGGNDSTPRFILAKEAHDTLTDSEKKLAYDRKLLKKSAAMAKVKHDLSFVSEYLKKKRAARPCANYSPQLKVTIAANQCFSCRGYGVRRDQFNMLKTCKLCGGKGRRKRGLF